MRDRKKTAGLVGAGALAILMSTAAFAAPAPRGNDRAQSNRTQSNQTYQQTNHGQSNQAYQVSDRNGQYGRAQDSRDQYNSGQDNRGQYNSSYGSRQQYVSGIVQRVDRRSGVLTLRDESSRRTIQINTSGMRMGNLRRGEYITVSGQWLRGNVFSAYSIDGGNSRRY